MGRQRDGPVLDSDVATGQSVEGESVAVPLRVERLQLGQREGLPTTAALLTEADDPSGRNLGLVVAEGVVQVLAGVDVFGPDGSVRSKHRSISLSGQTIRPRMSHETFMTLAREIIYKKSVQSMEHSYINT